MTNINDKKAINALFRKLRLGQILSIKITSIENGTKFMAEAPFVQIKHEISDTFEGALDAILRNYGFSTQSIEAVEMPGKPKLYFSFIDIEGRVVFRRKDDPSLLYRTIRKGFDSRLTVERILSSVTTSDFVEVTADDRETYTIPVDKFDIVREGADALVMYDEHIMTANKSQYGKIPLFFIGLDYMGRPVFKQKDVRNSPFYGSVDKVFGQYTSESDILDQISVEDLCFFGNKYSMSHGEPHGGDIIYDNYEIVRNDSDETPVAAIEGE
jgi:hypothetical protein